jgi:heat shock protein HslJ
MVGSKSSVLLISLGMGVMLTLLYFSAAASSGRDFGNDVVPADSWRMRTVSINGTGDPASVWENNYTLSINATHISGKICNGFAGDIQHLDNSTIRGQNVFATEMLCVATPGGGPDIMKVEELFLDGLVHGMKISESDDILELRDIMTNTTFIYSKDS